MSVLPHLAIALLSAPQRQPEAARTIVADALRQAREGAKYDASYQRLSYPMGDVSSSRGACTDVVIRALRAAGYDLQKLIHEDMANVRYPRAGKVRDRNIDHRRVPNQAFYFRRFGKSISVTRAKASQFLPGDFVAWKLPSGLDHIGVVVPGRPGGRPMIVHNLSTAKKEDVLFAWKIVGHYRFPG